MPESRSGGLQKKLFVFPSRHARSFFFIRESWEKPRSTMPRGSPRRRSPGARRSKASRCSRRSWRSPTRVRSKTSPRAPGAPPPNVHEWSRRDHVRVSLAAVKRETIRPPTKMRPDPVATPGLRVIRGGTDEAQSWYQRLYWDTNDGTEMPVDVGRFPLDVVVATRVKKPAEFFVNDPEYQRVTKTYKLIRNSCIVCDEIAKAVT